MKSAQKILWAQITLVSRGLGLCQAVMAVLACTWGIRAQLSEWRRRLLWIPAAMQASSGCARRTELCCLCLFVCSVPVSWSVLVPSVSILALLSFFLILFISFALLSLRLPLTLMYSAVLLQDCFWHYWVLGNTKLHHLQDIPLQLSKSILEIKWHSICCRKLSTVIKADVFPVVILPPFLANWPHLILNLLSGPLFIITANAQAIKPQ